MTTRLVDKRLTNGAYGFGSTKTRRIKPVILAVAHITGNSRTAAYSDQAKAVLAEWTYANRSGSKGPSSALYIGRHGRGYRAIDWRRYAQWSNGDVNRPDTDNAGIRRALALRARGYNLNEACGIEAELLGYGSAYPVLGGELDTFAEEIARAARYWQSHFEGFLGVKGEAIIRPTTVVGHFQINSVDRRCCPGCNGPALIAQLIDRSRAWYRKLYVTPAPAPTPVPTPTPTPEPTGGYLAMIATDKTPKTIVVRQGATLWDLNLKPLVQVANVAERLSPGGTKDGRLVWTYFSGATHLALAKTADVVSAVDVAPAIPADQAAKIAELERALLGWDAYGARVNSAIDAAVAELVAVRPT